MDSIAKRILFAAAFSSWAQMGALPGPGQRAVTTCADSGNRPYFFVPGDVTPVDGVTSIAPTPDTGRWLLGDDSISIGSLGGAADDWPRLNSIMSACAGKAKINLLPGAWRCATPGIVPSNTDLRGAPGVIVTSVLAPSGAQVNSVFTAFGPAPTISGTINVTPVAAATTVDCALPAPPVLPFALALTNAGGQTQQVFDARSVVNLGAGVYRIGLDRPIVFPFVATNTADVIASYPHDILIHGDGIRFTGTGDRVIEFARTARCVVRDVNYDTSGGAMSECAFSFDNGGRENVWENIQVDLTGAGANVAGILFESQERSVGRHCRVGWATGAAFEIINSFGTSIETSHSYNDSLGGFGADDGAGLGLGCFDCSFDRCTSVDSASSAFTSGHSIGTRITDCAAIAPALAIGINAGSVGAIISSFDVRDSSSGAIVGIASDAQFYGFNATNVTAPAGNVHKLINVVGAGDVAFYGLNVTTLASSAGDMQVLNIEGGNRTVVIGARIVIGNTNGYGFWNQLGVMTLEDAIVTGAGAGVFGARVSAGQTLRIGQGVSITAGCGGGGPLYIAGSFISRAAIVATQAVAVPVQFPDIKAEDSVELTLQIKGGLPSAMPAVVVTPGVGFSMTSYAGDTSTYGFAIL